ncbi:hypothetical protein L209DRAFT_766903 [Thermothelomyces heterothallicus CBS 203.75]
MASEASPLLARSPRPFATAHNAPLNTDPPPASTPQRDPTAPQRKSRQHPCGVVRDI